MYTKQVNHPDQAGAEAAGLAWLAEAVPEVVATVVGTTSHSISTQRVREAQPTAKAARAFGARLRRVHDAGAPAFGSPPAGWEGKNYIGRVEQDCSPGDDWGIFYARQRVRSFSRATPLPKSTESAVEEACELIEITEWDVSPARIHGDLWAGNVIFSGSSAVMIDPAAHGGHPHTDLGMLALFGAPFVEEIFAGYGFSEYETLPVHQLHPLAVHALTHGPGYYRALERAAKETIELLG
ncbi:fructosamine kinase [Corynebacterium phocae]|uniref:Fructosamine kinase n=1 Tax=Corynebacterium phocae TaxID=161895 RepID=A0A1L7D1P7_9CORY|nr:fructosamine kinase family protein [Corynebacterium phocae]APT91993.1 fructosamine kinase [Corynebacterium phocae]KAA8726369.1 phosphotransferase [Corynebacterium phocae]